MTNRKITHPEPREDLSFLLMTLLTSFPEITPPRNHPVYVWATLTNLSIHWHTVPANRKLTYAALPQGPGTRILNAEPTQTILATIIPSLVFKKCDPSSQVRSKLMPR